MNWKQYKRGLFLAGLSGVFTTLIALGGGMQWKAILILLGATIGKDCLLYMAKHPPDDIKDTTFFNNPQPKDKTNEKTPALPPGPGPDIGSPH